MLCWQTVSGRWQPKQTTPRRARPPSPGSFGSLPSPGHRSREILLLYRNFHKSLGGAAERLILAEDDREVAPDLSVGEGDRNQRLGPDILFDIRASDEAHADIGGYKTLQQFARIKLHGQIRLQVMVIEQGIERVARVT